MYLLYCACEAICSILQERVCQGFFPPQDIVFYLVKNKPNRTVLSDNHRRVEQPLCREAGDGSPGWVARNLRATEC